MNFLCIIIAVLCGIVLIFEIDTGSLEAFQVAGIGIIAAALASIAPAGWPARP